MYFPDPSSTVQSVISVFRRYRLAKRRDALQAEWDQRYEKLDGLRQASVLESGEAKKFELKKQIQAEEKEIERLERELNEVEQVLEGAASNAEERIEEVRSRCRQKMISQYNSIRLLNQTEITVDQLYVDVWLLKRPTQTLQPGAKMRELFDLRNDRLGLGDRDIRADGIKVANQNNRLLILGKPGAGKTTFLKHLAVDCSKERFQAELIPVLIELRRIRSTKWKLLDAIAEQLELSPQQTEKLIEEGQLLILMDGLDEVPSSAFRGEVQRQVRDLAQKPQHAGNRFILTCRTQIITGEIPQGFTAVEVADFTPKQVQRFVENWFRASGWTETEVEQQWQAFAEGIEQNPALKELTVTPVLLSLMCWVFEDAGELPTQAASLYDKGINLLLERWNERKEIPEWEMGNEVYRALTLEQKKRLLTEIAAWKFENPKNFVLSEQEVLTQQIVKLLNLNKPKDGEAVLRAIEAQHGLLVERADQLWSFSHLTFQEHFIVQWLTQLPSKQLTRKIVDRQWQESVKQLVKSQPSGELLKLIKQEIDKSISQDAKCQEFLTWICKKAEAANESYRTVALRAFYLTLTFDHSLDRALNSAFAFAFALTLDFDRGFALTLALDLELAKKLHRLKGCLPKDLKDSGDVESFRRWWHSQEQHWTEALRQIIIAHRTASHNWHFTTSEKQFLWQYHDANKFLVELLKLKGAVFVRQEIEDKLLLPIDHL